MIRDVKKTLQMIISDPRFSRRERHVAKSSLDRIEELENGEGYHWTEQARMALLQEMNEQVIGKQAATKMNSFLQRHKPRSK